MVDRDGGSGPRTDLDLDAAASAAVEAVREEGEARDPDSEDAVVVDMPPIDAVELAASAPIEGRPRARGTRDEVDPPQDHMKKQVRGTRDDVPALPPGALFGSPRSPSDVAREVSAPTPESRQVTRDFGANEATVEAKRPTTRDFAANEATVEAKRPTTRDFAARESTAASRGFDDFERDATRESATPIIAASKRDDFERDATGEAARPVAERDVRPHSATVPVTFERDATRESANPLIAAGKRDDFERDATGEAARPDAERDVRPHSATVPVNFERDATGEAARPVASATVPVNFERDATGEAVRPDTPTAPMDFERAAAAPEQPVRQVVDASSQQVGGFVLREKATEIDLRIAAAAAVEAARRDIEAVQDDALDRAKPVATPAPEHQTHPGAPTAMGTPAPKKAKPLAFAPTAALAELTADTPGSAASGGAVELEPLEELPEGTLLAGRYHITELVGQGGMGAVYAAHDDDLDEDIALKVLRPDLGRDVDFQRRLKAEVRLARRVSHPNVCRVHDIGVDDELVFVTMELVRGHTLRERLAETTAGRAEPLDLAQIVDIIVQIGSALSAAHRAGVIHRDVKPDNVILAGSRAVLTDFGVASMVVDRKHSIVGTPAYLAPEVLRHEVFDHRVDIYAVSCLAYELIAGHPPFSARTIDVALKLARDRPSYPGLPDTFGNAPVRAQLDRVLLRGLASDPHMRPPTMERFTDGFAHAARSAPQSLAVPGRKQERLSTQDSTTPAPLTRRTELRVTTALVWYANRGPKDTEEAERRVVDAGGVPIRVLPGEIVALFGATRSGGDDADRAAHTALAIVTQFGGRAGLDTTRILLRPSDNELAGPESATTAASLAHDASEGQVWASKATARQLAARFAIEAASGEARQVTGTRQHVDEVAIGSMRARELAEILAHLERAFRERMPVFVQVRGSAGSGKTRLRKAIMTAINARRDVEWMIAVTSPVGEPAPLSLVQSCSREWYEATTTAGHAREIDLAQRDLNAKRWLETRATHRPVVVVAEDLQWADPTSRQLLGYLRSNLERVPVAVLTFARAEQANPDPTGVNVVTLAPLDDQVATSVARKIAPNATDEAIAAIVQRAAGNPFFIEELAREAASGSSELPTSIEAVVQAHLDQLPAIANQVASAAGVVGHGFWRGAIARLMPSLEEAHLDAALADLERAGVIAPATRSTILDDHYQFTSALVRDVAYARLPARERRQQHGVVAMWLDEQTRSADQDAPRLLAVAHHREHAGDAARAALAYRQAGKRCLDLFAYGEAATALRKAAALVTVPDPVLDEALADALTHTEGYAAAEPIYQRALDETDDDDHPARARLHYKLGSAASKRGNTQNAIARYKAGLAIAAPGDQLAAWAHADPRTPALLWAGLGWTLGYQLGDVEAGHPFCERAVAVLEETPHRRDLAQALSRLGGTYMRACRFSDQLRCNQRNLEIAVELGDLNMQLTANINLGVVYGVLGELEQAVSATLAARKLAARMAAAASDGLAASNLAGYYLELGRLDDADALLDEAIATIERTGSRYVLCESLVFRARIAAARGKFSDARKHADRSLALARQLGNQLDAAIALRILASLDGRMGLYDSARQRIEEALVLATIHDEFESIRTRAARARILAVAGETGADAELADLEAELKRLGTKRELSVLRDLSQVR